MIRVIAKDKRIQVLLDGDTALDIIDGSFPTGHLGLNVFGGRASYHDLYAARSRP